MKREEDINRVMELYGNSIYRLSYYVLQNEHDAQDILQETLIKYMQKFQDFQNEEHEKAWLFRVSNNLCKDMLRFQKRNRFLNIDTLVEQQDDSSFHEGETVGLLKTHIFRLQEKYKKVIYLHYYEGYSVKEMAYILKISEGAVKKRLERGRDQLREMMKEDL